MSFEPHFFMKSMKWTLINYFYWKKKYSDVENKVKIPCGLLYIIEILFVVKFVIFNLKYRFKHPNWNSNSLLQFYTKRTKNHFRDCSFKIQNEPQFWMKRLLNRNLTHRETLELTHTNIIHLTLKISGIGLDSGQIILCDDFRN